MIQITKQAAQSVLDALALNNAKWRSLADSGYAGFWNAEDQDHYVQTKKAIGIMQAAIDATPPSGEREALIDELRTYAPNNITRKAADMLAADAQKSPDDALLDHLHNIIAAKAVMRAAGVNQADFPTMFKEFAQQVTAPQARELSDDEIDDIWASVALDVPPYINFVRAVLAAARGIP